MAIVEEQRLYDELIGALERSYDFSVDYSESNNEEGKHPEQRCAGHIKVVPITESSESILKNIENYLDDNLKNLCSRVGESGDLVLYREVEGGKYDRVSLKF